MYEVPLWKYNSIAPPLASQAVNIPADPFPICFLDCNSTVHPTFKLFTWVVHIAELIIQEPTTNDWQNQSKQRLDEQERRWIILKKLEI